MSRENKLELSGEVENEDYVRKDLFKAIQILLFSLISAGIMTIILYFLPI